MDNIKQGDSVILIWNNCDQYDLTNIVTELQNRVSEGGSVVLENSERISICKLTRCLYLKFKI